jgi:hypothetical protein
MEQLEIELDSSRFQTETEKGIAQQGIPFLFKVIPSDLCMTKVSMMPTLVSAERNQTELFFINLKPSRQALINLGQT